MSFIDKIADEFPVGNAAGWCKSTEEVANLADSAAQFIVVGSITVKEHIGNPGNTFDGESLNSLGLPNPGIARISSDASVLLERAHKENKPVILSIAGFNPKEYEYLASCALDLGFDGVEINLGCPNVVDGGKRKPIASFDIPSIEQIVTKVRWLSSASSQAFVSVKVSPMSNPQDIIDTVAILVAGGINAVVTQNTVPNCLLYNRNGAPVIQTPDGTGLAGLSGKFVKPMALGQVIQWRAALDATGARDVQVWGVGGVESGQDVKDMLLAGASRVQIGTAYFTGGAKVFGDIANEFFNP